jgi:hypothetical protein
MPAFHTKFLDALAITTAVSATAGATIAKGLRGVYYIVAQAKFVYGSGGTTAKAYLQTSVDGGASWIDIMCFAFATATATKVSAVPVTTALAAGVTPTDGSLADNTILAGLIGSMFRIKYVTTGTYAGGTTLTVDVQFLSVGA